MTSGTVTAVGPVDTVSCTVVPSSTFVPGGGSLLMTSPSGTVSLGAVTFVEVSLALAICATAVCSGRPTTWGTVT